MKALQLLILIFLSAIPAMAKIRLALNWKPEPQFGGFYAAQEYFAKEKLPVEIKVGGSGTPTIQMLASGQVEYAIVSADEIILAHDRGATDIVALYASFQTNPQMIMSHESQGYKSIKDLFADSKATLLWQSGLPYAQFLNKKYNPIKARIAPYSGGIASFQGNPKISQQGFITSEPLIAKAQGIKIKTFLVADEGYNPYTTVLVTQKSRLKQNPEEVRKVVAAVRSGWTDYLKDPSQTNLKMSKLNPSQSVETLLESAKAQLNLIGAEAGKMSPERWTQLVDQLFELKIIKSKPAPDALFTNI